MVTDKVKLAVLESWFGIDRVLFGIKEPSKCLVEKSLKEYNKVKASLLFNLGEIYKLVDYGSTKKYSNAKQLVESVFAEIDESRAITINEMKRGLHKNSLLEGVAIFEKAESLDRETASNVIVPRMTLSILLDDYMVIRAFRNFKNPEMKKLSENETLVFLLTAHDKFRDQLVETVFAGTF